nr:odorant binding protein [Semanotus bifasciatus]
MVPLSFFLTVTVLVFGVNVHGFPDMEKFMGMPGVRECISSSGVDQEELKKRPGPDMSPEYLCFLKCTAEAVGTLSEDGEIDSENTQGLPMLMNMPEDTKNEVMECMANVGKIETCDDMIKMLECAPKPPKP